MTTVGKERVRNINMTFQVENQYENNETIKRQSNTGCKSRCKQLSKPLQSRNLKRSFTLEESNVYREANFILLNTIKISIKNCKL